MNHISQDNRQLSKLATNGNNQLIKSRNEIISSVEGLLDFDVNLLDNLSKVSKSIILRGEYQNKQIIIPFDIVDYISEKTGSDIQKYIANREFKTKIISVLKLDGNYGFFIDISKKSIILIPINSSGTREVSNRYLGIGDVNLSYLLSNVLPLSTPEKRRELVASINSSIDLSDLSREDLAHYYSSGNYLSFIYEKLTDEVYRIADGNIDLELSRGIAGAILREDFDMEIKHIGDFFQVLSKIVNIPKSQNDEIYIDIADIEQIIKEKNIDLKKFISNPILKRKIREVLKLTGNYGMIISPDSKKIIMMPVDSKQKRYAGLSKFNANYIINDILKLDSKEKKSLFLDNAISKINAQLESIDIKDIEGQKFLLNFTSGNYLNYIFVEIAKEVYSLSKGTIDTDMARGVAGALFREDFDFVNSNLGCSFTQKLSMMSAMRLSRLYRIDEDLEQKFKTSVDILEDYLRTNLVDIDVNAFRKSFSNDIYTEFSIKVKNSFDHIAGIKNLDENLVKGMFIHVVNKGEIENPMKQFTELVFSKIITKYKELSKLFAFFDGKVFPVGKESYKYPSFKFRDLEILDDNYSVEKVFLFIRNKLERITEINSEIASINRPNADKTFRLDSLRKSINSKLEELPKRNDELKILEKNIDDLERNIPQGLLAFSKRKKAMEELESLKNLKIELEKKIDSIKKYVSDSNKEIVDLASEIKALTQNSKILKLEEEKKDLEEQVYRIKEDFANTLFCGLRQDKKVDR